MKPNIPFRIRLCLTACLVMTCGIQISYAQNFQEIIKAVASDPDVADFFGRSVSISGDLAIVGASEEDTGGTDAGAAYIFARNEGGADNWGEVKKIQASDKQAGDLFGFSVSISEDRAIVGAFVPGVSDAGAAYIFARNEGGADNWGEVQKIQASDKQADDFFGFSVSISGDLAIVGAPGEDTGGSFAGAAYIFARDEGGADQWGQVKKILASDKQAGDQFGISVSISEDLAIVGARFEDTGGSSAGAAYIFARNEGGADMWGEVQKIQASDKQAFDEFGSSVSISGDGAIVGAPFEDTGGSNAGAAYIFARNEGGADHWGEVKKIQAIDKQVGDFFGNRVSISGDLAIVGADGEGTGGSNAGAAYIFARNEGGADMWGEVKKIQASDKEAGDQFGFSVSISGDRAIVGAFREDTGGSAAGAAYIFAPACELTAVTPTIPACTSGGSTVFEVAYDGMILSSTQTVVAAADGFGLTAGQVLAMGNSSPISVSLSNQPNSGTLMLRLQDAGDAACSATFSVQLPGCVPPIPTMGEWALLFMGLFLLTLFSAYVTVPALSTASASSSSTFQFQKLPFDLQGYLKLWLMVVCGILFLFAIAILGFGYALTSADPVGATVCSFVWAYWIYLITK